MTDLGPFNDGDIAPTYLDPQNPYNIGSTPPAAPAAPPNSSSPASAQGAAF